MNAVAESTALRPFHSKLPAPGLISRAMLNSLCLHATVFLLLFLGLQHHRSAPLPKRPMAVIALNAPLNAQPAPGAISFHTPPAAPRHRHHSSGATTRASRPIRPMPPAPALQTASLPSSAEVATAPETNPAPPAAAMPPAPIAAPAAAAETGAAYPGNAQPPLSPPLAYLSEVSRVIRVHLDDQRPHVHGLTVVHIRIARDGTLLEAEIAQSSGSKSVDEKALSVILGIHRFPEPPSAYVSAIGDFSIDQPIRFLG